jgi:hypothetical protein
MLEALVTSQACALLALEDRGVLRAGALADLLILPAGLPLWRATRADIRGVLVGGGKVYGDADCAAALLPAAERVSVRIDGSSKVLARALADGIADHGVREHGFEFARETGRAA